MKKSKKAVQSDRDALLIAKGYLVVCKYCNHTVHNGNYCENCGHKLNYRKSKIEVLEKKYIQFWAVHYKLAYFLEYVFVPIVVSAITTFGLRFLFPKG